MVSASEGWEGYVRIKLENNSNNWSITNINGTTYNYPRDPRLTSAPFDTDVAMEKIYVIGSRTAVDTVEGVIDITGSIERPFFLNESINQIVWAANYSAVNQSQFRLADVSGLYGTNVSKCAMMIKPNSNQTYVLHNVKFHSYGFGMASGEIATERVDFTADNISTK